MLRVSNDHLFGFGTMCYFTDNPFGNHQDLSNLDT
jgi:hypothetical protein